MCEEPKGPIPVGEALEELPDEELLYDLADLFKVFSDTTRIKILFALMGRELCVADIAETTGTTKAAGGEQHRTSSSSSATAATSSTRSPTTMSTPCSTRA